MDKYLWERIRIFLPRDDLLCLRETSEFHAEMRVVRARLDDDALMRVGWNAEAMEPNAFHKAVDGNDDDNANTEAHSDYDIEMLIERISHEAVAEHLNDAGKNRANSEESLGEPEFV